LLKKLTIFYLIPVIRVSEYEREKNI